MTSYLGCLIAVVARTTTIGATHASSASSLDARSASQTTLELEEGTADLVLHGRSALVVMNRCSGRGMSSSTGTAAKHAAATGLRGCGCGCCSMTVRMGRGTATGAKDGATGRGVTVSSCERHIEW